MRVCDEGAWKVNSSSKERGGLRGNRRDNSSSGVLRRDYCKCIVGVCYCQGVLSFGGDNRKYCQHQK
jgi:hypothetical protein